MIIDFHTHTFPDAIAPKALAKLQGASHSRAFSDATVAALQADMAERGIDFSIVLPVATNPLKVAHMNDSSAAMNGQGPLIHFGAMHPDFEGWYEELGRIKDLGLKGIKIHPVYQGVDIDDERYLRIFRRCAELDLIVVAHSGDDIGFPGVVRCDPKRSRNALQQAEGVKLVLAHMGGWRNWDEVEDLLADTGVYLDTSFCFGRIPHPLAQRIVEKHGTDRILFGTDLPWSDAWTERRLIESLNLTQSDKENIFFRNAAQLLKLSDGNPDFSAF